MSLLRYCKEIHNAQFDLIFNKCLVPWSQKLIHIGVWSGCGCLIIKIPFTSMSFVRIEHYLWITVKTPHWNSNKSNIDLSGYKWKYIKPVLLIHLLWKCISKYTGNRPFVISITLKFTITFCQLKWKCIFILKI